MRLRGIEIRVYRDGREVVGRIEYKLRILAMLKRQRGLCCLCGASLSESEATFEHQDGRGMGGGKRDDRILKDGKPYNGAAHNLCNYAKGSRRVAYVA